MDANLHTYEFGIALRQQMVGAASPSSAIIPKSLPRELMSHPFTKKS